MPKSFHRPVRRPSASFDNIVGAGDPADDLRVAHATASALLERARTDATGETARRLIDFTAEHGIDEIAEAWAKAPARSLPGALWRLYLLQASIQGDPAITALLYERGRVALPTADAAIAGAPTPASPEELGALIDTIMHGVFRGDFAIALDRAAAFCRVVSAGSTHAADDYEGTEPQRATALTQRAYRLTTSAEDLAACAAAWRRGALI